MSKRLQDCSSYLKVLLSNNKVQSEAVLVTASVKQVNCLAEIIKNILQLPVSIKTSTLLKKHKKLLTTLGDTKVPVKKRLHLIQKWHSVILSVLLSVKTKLLPLLD